MPMKIYSYPSAPSARRARMFLAEKGMKIAIENVDLRQGEHQKPRYLTVNSRGLIPTLQLEDGTTITENIAIAAYLEALSPSPALFGSTPLQRARAMEWNARVELEGLLPLADHIRHSHPSFEHRALPGVVPYEQIAALAERGRNRVEHFLRILDIRLSEQQYLAAMISAWPTSPASSSSICSRWPS
jgi:glutathione S-transferase